MTPPLSPGRVSAQPPGCEGFADAIFDRAAGRLDPTRARGLEVHLAGCPACRGLVDEVGQTEETLRGLLLDLAGPEPAAAAAQNPDIRRSRAGRPRLVRRLAWAAGLLVATGLGVALSWPQTGGTSSHRRSRPADLARNVHEAPSLLTQTAPRPDPMETTPIAEAGDTLRLALLDAFSVPE